MAKQLLIYGSIKPVSSENHRDWSVQTGDNYSFAKNTNSVPVMAAEFPKAASDNAIVFTGDKNLIMPVLIMGIRDKESLYINARGKWLARYVPAFLRRYPFVFSSADRGKSFTLCIDEEFEGCNQQGRGERLFDDDGTQTLYLKNVLEFLKEYQAHYRRTEAFSKKLLELDVLEPMTAQFTGPDGSKSNLTGFMAVNRDKLKKLDGEQLARLAATDELELIYIHLQSLQNLTSMLGRFAGEDSQAKSPEVGQNTGTVDPNPATGKKTGPSGKRPAKKKTVKKQ